MLTSDPIYWRPYKPVITIRNTSAASILYTYSAHDGQASSGPNILDIFPIYCSVTLSQNTHGEFTIQFEDADKEIEALGVTVGARVIITAQKQIVAPQQRLISGLIRKKGYSRGADNKLLYTISGASTGIRLNEHIVYINSEAARTPTGQLDFTDATRKADSLMALALNALTADGILDKSSLAVNSDVETFIPSLQVEFGEMQDAVNYIEDQSGGELVIDTNDDVNFRYEIKNTFFGRGFTLKNKYTPAAATTGDDADDTMYLVHKNWTYEDSFYKSDAYANRLFALLPAEETPDLETLIYGGFSKNYGQNTPTTGGNEHAIKFRPNHSHFLPGDFFVRGMSDTGESASEEELVFRISTDNGGTPNGGAIVANIGFRMGDFPNDFNSLGTAIQFSVGQSRQIYNSSFSPISSFDLSTVLDYWFIMSSKNMISNTEKPPGDGNTYATRFGWMAYDTPTPPPHYFADIGTTSDSSAGSGWNVVSSSNTFAFAIPRQRAYEFRIWDPKAVMAVSSGLAGGQFVSTTLSDISSLVTTKEAMYRHLAQQIYNMARPRTSYSFPSVTAPNIPPFPGDPIIISDSVLGFSTTGNQIVQTVCGDMTYTWGAMDAGNYEAPTILSINAIGVHPRYR